MKRSYIFLAIVSLGMSWFLITCQSSLNNGDLSPLEKNLMRAGANRTELEQVLAHYQQHPADSLKYRAAVALISAMDQQQHFEDPWLRQYDQIFQATATLDEVGIKSLRDSMYNKIGRFGSGSLDTKEDLRSLKAVYLIENIEQAFAAWERSPGRENITFETFCNYILPYKNYNEYPESWRKELYERYDWILQDSITGSSMDEVVCAYNDDLQTWFRYSNYLDSYPGRISINNLLQGGRGNCADMSGLAAYVGRALGLPVALDYMSQWATNNGGHSWNALIINEKESIPFMGAEGNPGTYTVLQEGEARIAKVSRRTLLAQAQSFAAQAQKLGIPVNDIPKNAFDLYAKDVTNLYTAVSDLTITVTKKKEKVLYLGIYRLGNWAVMAGSIIDDNQTAIFKNVGRNVPYIPLFYDGNTYEVAGDPFILTFDGAVEMLIPDVAKKQKMVLSRTSSLSRWNIKSEFADALNGAIFEGSNDPEFKHSTTLHTIQEAMKDWTVMETGGPRTRDQLQYASLWETADVNNPRAFRHVRIKFADNQRFRLGDLAFFTDDSDMPLNGQPIGNIENPEYAFDGTFGYNIIHDEVHPRQWVGLDLGSPQKISRIKFIPAQGDNKVFVGKTYELLYWDKKWKVLAKKTANDHLLEFDHVPQNALYRLRCVDCEDATERPFTYENGGQVWW